MFTPNISVFRNSQSFKISKLPVFQKFKIANILKFENCQYFKNLELTIFQNFKIANDSNFQYFEYFRNFKIANISELHVHTHFSH